MNYFNIQLRFVEWFGLECIVSLINYLPLRGGLLSKALYLKKKHSFSYSHFASFLAAINLISLLCLSVVGLLGMGFLCWRYAIINNILSGFLIGGVVIALIILFLPLKISAKESNNRWMRFFLDAINQWNKLKQSKLTVLALFIIECAILFSYTMRLYIIFKIISLPTPFSSCIIIATLSSLSTFIPLAPGGLGVREATISLTTKVIGNTLKEGFTASLVDRVISMLVIFLLGGVFFFFLFGRKIERLNS